MTELLKEFTPADVTASVDAEGRVTDHRTASHEFQASVADEHPTAEVRYNPDTDTYEVWSGPRPVEVQAVEEEVLRAAKQGAGYDEGRAIIMSDEDFDLLADKVADRITGRLVTALGLER